MFRTIRFSCFVFFFFWKDGSQIIMGKFPRDQRVSENTDGDPPTDGFKEKLTRNQPSPPKHGCCLVVNFPFKGSQKKTPCFFGPPAHCPETAAKQGLETCTESLQDKNATVGTISFVGTDLNMDVPCLMCLMWVRGT